MDLLFDLENHIVAMPEIAQAAVVAQPHPKWDERPVAMVIMAAGETLDQAAVIEHCSQIFAKWQLPDEVIAVESLPPARPARSRKKPSEPTWKKKATGFRIYAEIIAAAVDKKGSLRLPFSSLPQRPGSVGA